MNEEKSFRDVAVNIRKLRKKLRQIENLERLERELTREECRKVLSKDAYREQLQELVKEQEVSMVTLKTSAVNDDDKTINTSENFTDELKIVNDELSDAVNKNKVVFNEDIDIEYDEKKLEDSFEPQFFKSGMNSQLANGGQIFGGHHLDHHRTVHHFDGATGGLSLGFDENGEITADVFENDDINGETQTNIPVDADNTSGTSKQNDEEKLPSLLVFQNLELKMKLFEGHHEDTCAIDLYGDYVISGGRDTSLKLWLATNQEEVKSIGGHTATITGVKFLKDLPFINYPNAVSSSYDCSIKVWDLENGTIKNSIYVYSPIVCMDYSCGHIAVGTEGGKVEVYSVEDGKQIFSSRIYDDLVSAIKILNNGLVACGSTDGVLKIVNPKEKADKSIVFELDASKVHVKQAIESEQDLGEVKEIALSMSKITCIEVYDDIVIYGDEGFNIKAIDYKKGEVVKMRNNLKEFSPTEALYVGRVRERDFLFCVGSDIDQGDGFTNVRSLPDFKYMGTIRDPNVNSGRISAFCLEDVNNRIRFITAGSQLRTWDQINTRQSRKRKSDDQDPPYVPCKFVCTYTVPRESEPESDSEGKSSQSESETEVTSTKDNEPEAPKQSWCQIL